MKILEINGYPHFNKNCYSSFHNLGLLDIFLTVQKVMNNLDIRQIVKGENSDENSDENLDKNLRNK